MTTEPLTPAEISALRALAEKATPGPWRQHLVDDTTVVDRFGEEIAQTFPEGGNNDDVDFATNTEQREDDAAFIAAARDALPRALDTLEAQAKTIAERDAEIALLEAKTAELRQALWPFAFEAGMWADHVPDDGRPTVLEIGKTDAENYGSPAQYSIGDLRRARAALAKEPQT